jgi:hypothetical protein
MIDALRADSGASLLNAVLCRCATLHPTKDVIRAAISGFGGSVLGVPRRPIRLEWRSGGLGQGEQSAVFEVGSLVQGEQVGDAAPLPTRSVAPAGLGRLQRSAPSVAPLAGHLPSMRLAYHPGQIGRQIGGFVLDQPTCLELQVLRHQVPHDDGLAHESGRDHPLTEIGRERPGSSDHPHRVVAGHAHRLRARGGRDGRLLEIHQAERRGLALGDPHHGGEPQAA